MKALVIMAMTVHPDGNPIERFEPKHV